MKKDRLKKFSLFLLPFFFWSIIFPAVGRAVPAIPGFYGTVTPPLPPPSVNALPVLKNVVQGASVPGASNNRLVVYQNQPKAILEWHSFDIGEDASTHFDQGNANWVALNRIFDQNPSQIFGALTADGKIYLINQNGILFSPSSKVNVHSLVASSLNIKDDDFLGGLLKFKAENYQSKPGWDINTNVAVSNHGVIETDESGSVFLLAPTVENSGVIVTPIGQIGLAAGTEVDIPHYVGGYEVYLDVKDPGEHGFAVNFENGWLIADTGLAGMYGRVVNQEGLIRSVTAIKKQGRIELLASEKVSTGANSVTIAPVSSSSETAHQSFEIREGEITIAGGERIEHSGIIYAPSGTVNLKASERVYLESGSVTDVSGMWVDKSGEANLIEVQLNSVQLRDDYGQKGGLLQGETITANALAGSAIGDISGHLVSDEMTALERSTEGGIINISASSGDIIVKEGAMIDFSGGGIRYGEGNFQTTKLLAGDRIYDISEAPQWIQYDKIMGFQEKRHERYGITEKYEGLYYGGANSLNDYMPGHVEVSNAGLLTLIAKRIILDGEIRGSAFQGIYQTEKAEPLDDYNCQRARGRRQPAGGTLIIGDPADERAEPPEGEYDFVLDDVVVRSEVEPVEDTFGADPDDFPYPEGKTYLSASILNNAGLSNLEIYTNGVFETEENARIILEPGNWQGGWKDNRDNTILNNLPIGRFHAVAGSILHQGEINVPAGHIKLMIRDTTNDFSQANKQLFLADGSKIVARGEEIDNSLSGASGAEPLRTGHIHGGYVTIADETYTKGKGVFVMSEALIDVGGGYEMDENGDIHGGDGGALSLAGQTLLMEGDIRGHSLVGRDGGTIIMHANQVSVVKPSELAPVPTDLTPENVSAVLEEMDLDGKMVLAENRLERTGFSQVELRSVSHLSVEEGVILEPSRARRPMPETRVAGQQTGMPQNVNLVDSGVDGTVGPDGFIRVAPEYAGDTSITLKAGQKLRYYEPTNIWAAQLTLKPGSKIHTAPGGTIEMEGPRVDVSGDLEAPSGKVKLTATGTAAGYGNLTFRTGSRILAAGYNRQQTEPLVKGLPAGFTPMPSGEVILETKRGDLIMESGTLIDVSGSAPTTNFIRNSDGTISSVTVAGDPGSIELAYFNNMTLYGQLKAHAQLDGLRGGSLAISRSNHQDDIPLTIRADDINRYQADGFDALTFGSLAGLKFSGSMNLEIGRSLTLNAPEIIGEDGQSVSLTAPWLRLANTREKYPNIEGLDSYDFIPEQAESGNGMITLSGEWLDIDGSVTLSKFKDVNLDVQQDIRLTDEIYKDTWEGMLKAPGNLTMTAARISPTTRSDFTIKSGGKVTTRRSESAPCGPVFSAGGSLTIEANKIEHRGVLAAPMGKINLYGVGDDSRVYLAEGSLVSTKGEGRVKYGTLGEIFWTIKDKENPSNADGIAVEDAPEKSVDISIIDNPGGGGEVIVREGAEIDASGGGSVFSYKFLAGIEGSEDPLKKEGRYVILPDNSVSLPGEAVYLEGADGLPAGTYSLLPEEYAFVPGAMVITDLGELERELRAGEQIFSEEGYTVVPGYAMVMGTDIRSPRPRGYALRSAADVLKEGYFKIGELTAGDAGRVVINGPTTILDGTIKGKALPGYQGGLLSMSAAKNAIVRASVSLPSGFGFGDSIPVDLVGECNISSDGLAGRGLRELNIGDIGTTNTITLEDGSILDAPLVTLFAINTITLESGARIEAMGDGGTASLISPDGDVIIEENALVHASDAVNLETSNFTLEGEMKVDNSRLNLQGANIFIVPDDYTGNKNPGTIYLTESLWGLTGFDNIGFISQNDLTFLGNVDLEVAEELTIDTKRIAGLDLDGKKTSNITSQTINFLNTKEAFAGVDIGDDTSTITFTAQEMTVGHGDILFDGFSAVNLNSDSDLTFKGKGSLISSGDLNMSAARVTTSYYQDAGISYEVARFQVDAEANAININKRGIAKDTKIPGGSLEFLARTIDHSGIVDVTSGRVKFIATGSGADDGIFLKNGSQILARGSDYAPGGRLDLQTEQGVLNIEAGSKIDVSAGGQGDAGTISLVAPQDNVLVAGTLQGQAQEGKGGSFALDTNVLDLDLDTDTDTDTDQDDFSALNTKLTQGGFNQEVNIRARSGNVDIAANDTVLARQFKLTVDKTGADDGDIDLLGKIDASGDEGGTVELYAGSDLTLDGTIDAHSSGAGLPGGEVILSAAEGAVIFNQEAYIDVSAGPEAPLDYAEQPAQGGEVSFRALRDKIDDGVAKGTVKGASRIIVEGVKTYEYTGSQTFNSVSDTRVTEWKTDANSFLTSEGDINSLFMGDEGLTPLDREGEPDSDVSFLLLPGVEVRVLGDGEDPGNLTMAFDWELAAPNPYNPQTINYWLGNDKAGRLALRAEGNLNIEGNIIDSRTPNKYSPRYGLFSNVPGEDSWGILLAAGADLQSADPLSVRELQGDLTISDKKVVCTENAPISFASGNDTTLLHGYPSFWGEKGFMINDKMTYNLATYRGSILGRVGGNLNIGGGGNQTEDKSGGIQTALGDIDIRVGENLNMEYDNYSKSVGIRTTGGARHYEWSDRDNWPEYLDELKNSIWCLPWMPDWCQQDLDKYVHDHYHLYAQHAGRGDIVLHIGGDVNVSGGTAFSSEAWDYEHKYNQWTACYEDGPWSGTDYFPVGGLATMAGGDLKVSAGGDFESKAGTFGKGDLSIFAGGDIDGKFLVRDGRGEIGALGNFGLDHLNPSGELEPEAGKTIEAFSAQIDVTAQGDVIIGEVLNPTTRINSMFDDINEVQLRYAEDAALRVRAVTGDVILSSPMIDGVAPLLPPIFDVEAGGDIYMENRFVLAPSRSGHLRLVAGGNIDGGYMTAALGYTNTDIIISDIAPEAAYANYPKPQYVDEDRETQIYKCKRRGGGVGKPLMEDKYLHGFPTNTGYGDQDYINIYGEMMKGDMALIEDPEERAFFEGISDRFYDPVHAEDDKSVEIRAGRDIRNLNLFLPKKAEIKAGRDIRDIYYIGQNINSEDVATIRAGRDIFFSTAARNYRTGIEYGGPGFLLVQAGNSIDLGTTKGIQSIGNLYSPMLGSKGCSLVVISGSNKDIEPDQAVTFFDQLRDAGVEYSNLLAGGDAGLALERVEEAREEIIKPFFLGNTAGEGDIDMVRSQIMTAGSDSGIFVIARGDFNVGRSAFVAEGERENSGVLTESNGPINVFADGDVNVFESRVMTMMGGDIMAWSDKGDINAGRGSKTTVSRGKPKMVWKDDHWEIQRKAVAVGSGIRTLTYDPDGFEGPLEPPLAGDAYLFAPEGIIDAGEAGISARNVILGATEILNAQNIEVTGVSVGVPVASEGASGLGALAGAGSLAATSGLTEEMAGLDAGENVAEGYSEPEDYTPTWLKVKVVGFDEEKDDDT